MRYAGFWVRLVAAVVDSFLLQLVIVSPFVVAGVDSANAYNDAVSAGIVFIAVCLFCWLYFTLFESGGWQATPGKRLLGLRVTDLSGERISFGRASGRYFSKILSWLIFYIGFIMAGFTEKKQGLHDKFAGTLVLRGNAGAEGASLGTNPVTDDALMRTVYVPQSHTNHWVFSGFDDNGHVVRMSFSQDNPKLEQDGLLIGRDAKTSDLHMRDISVSRRHARLFNDQGKVWIEDLGSVNGTLINGREVKAGKPVELPLQGGITFGAVELVLTKY